MAIPVWNSSKLLTDCYTPPPTTKQGGSIKRSHALLHCATWNSWEVNIHMTHGSHTMDYWVFGSPSISSICIFISLLSSVSDTPWASSLFRVFLGDFKLLEAGRSAVNLFYVVAQSLLNVGWVSDESVNASKARWKDFILFERKKKDRILWLKSNLT